MSKPSAQRHSLAQDPLCLTTHHSSPHGPALITCIPLLCLLRCQRVTILNQPSTFISPYLYSFTCIVPSASNALSLDNPATTSDKHALHTLQHQLKYSFLQETISTFPNKISPPFQSAPKVHFPVAILIALVFIQHCKYITHLVFYETVKSLKVDIE